METYVESEDESIINKSFIETSYGKIRIRSVGKNTDPLFLIIHGSGPRNSGKSYSFFLHEYAIRFLNTWPVYMVAFDCPGYGESSGLKSVIRGFAEKFVSELIYGLTGKKNAFILMGHSQGGNSLFTAVFENPSITNFVIAERPVIADPKKFKDCKIPILFVYDEEDDGHPIKQGREMTKFVKYYKFISYKNSREPYWHNDHLIEEVLKFLNENQKFFYEKADLPDFELIKEVNEIKFKYATGTELPKTDKNNNNNSNINSNNNLIGKVNSAIDKKEQSKNFQENVNKVSRTSPPKNDFKTNASKNYVDIALSKSKNLNVNLIVKETVNSVIQEKENPDRILIPEELDEQEDHDEIYYSRKPSTKDIANLTNNNGKMLNEAMEKLNKINLEQEEDNFSKFESPENDSSSNSNTLSDFSISLKCCLCIEVFIKPIKLPCSHTFCLNCIEKCLLYKPHCPVCREGFSTEKITEILKPKNINADLELQVIELMGKESYEKKIAELSAEKKIEDSNQIQIEYGNLAELLNAQRAFVPKTKCKWTIYAKAVKSPISLPIEKVEFFINPHLPKCPPITVTQSPFILERNGSYEFGMSMKIHFKKKLNIPPYSTDYELNLRQPKSFRNFFVKCKI